MQEHGTTFDAADAPFSIAWSMHYHEKLFVAVPDGIIPAGLGVCFEGSNVFRPSKNTADNLEEEVCLRCFLLGC